jgi:predicted HicB family RNase H-like nuclease
MAQNREKTVNLNVRMSPEEAEQLKAIAKDKGLSISDVIRQYIRATYKKLVARG